MKWQQVVAYRASEPNAMWGAASDAIFQFMKWDQRGIDAINNNCTGTIQEIQKI